MLDEHKSRVEEARGALHMQQQLFLHTRVRTPHHSTGDSPDMTRKAPGKTIKALDD